jgi:hypothetical protein
MTAGQQPPLTSELVGAADLIVVGRIVGLADSSPSAQARRQYEMHLFDVVQTLKGPDHAGQRLGARPNGAVWSDGAAYILLLRSGPGNIVETLSQPLLPASPEEIARVERLVRERGEGVTERRVLWMVRTNPIGPAPLVELYVTASRAFEWKTPASSGQSPVSLTGRLPEGQVQSLVQRIRDADPGPIVDDASVLLFGWLDESGARQMKTCYLVAPNDCQTLLDDIERLVRLHVGG